MTEEADLLVHMVSVDIDTDAMGKPITDFVHGLRSNVNLVRQAYEEQFQQEDGQDD